MAYELQKYSVRLNAYQIGFLTGKLVKMIQEENTDEHEIIVYKDIIKQLNEATSQFGKPT